ncbi:hypothetical protein, partial [Flavobacterium sp.]|uniref:hypothetical protein n=1 Tax=Flavobacterium sp. TaxID=239 RepID=UPI002622ED53
SVVKNPIDNIVHEKLIVNDTINKIAFAEKIKGKNKITICVKHFERNNHYASVITNKLLSKIVFDSLDNNKLSVMSIFNNYSGVLKNQLQARNKLLNAPKSIDHSDKKSNWQNGLRWQMLMTVNSFLSNNYTYDTLIKRYESKRRMFYTKQIDSINQKRGLIKNQNVINTISELAKNNQIIILNEDHYYPKHRLFAMQLLNILKQNGYEYLSAEAFSLSEKSKLVPNYDNGHYIGEPYFAHFLRRAKELNFKIVGHENEDENVDREIGQANQIMKVLKSNPDAKIFIYVGHSHLEKESKKRWMASYLKEYSKINPITINQVKIISNTVEDLIMIPREFLDNKIKSSSSADYFIVNNIKTDLKAIYKDKEFKDIVLKSKFLKKFKDDELQLEIFDKEEYNQLKSLAIPIINLIVKAKNKQIKLNLPIGSYYIIVKSADNEIFRFDQIEVK